MAALFRLIRTFVVAYLVLGISQIAMAHPHVFVEANVDIVQDEEGRATEIRHVWRFDVIFTTSLLLDFDANGNDVLDEAELDEIAQITRASLAEFNFYTEIRKNTEIVYFHEPDPYLLKVENDQLIMILALSLEEPVEIGSKGFKVAVSDPTYYVAVEFADEDAVRVVGSAGACNTRIERPDFDALWERDAERMEELFSAGPDEDVEASDDYLTWVHLECAST